jgi:hypothetical protein
MKPLTTLFVSLISAFTGLVSETRLVQDMMLVAKKDKLSDPTKMEGSSNVGFSSEQQKASRLLRVIPVVVTLPAP